MKKNSLFSKICTTSNSKITGSNFEWKVLEVSYHKIYFQYFFQIMIIFATFRVMSSWNVASENNHTVCTLNYRYLKWWCGFVHLSISSWMQQRSFDIEFISDNPFLSVCWSVMHMVWPATFYWRKKFSLTLIVIEFSLVILSC